ncbi:hypothetical protein FHETE_5984 [Fusarium heterosporum]|uniref:2EXR domain-containing protein n=1 Tax=Fusarium heterosporum TaxID=42747 RepID=A0A8H5TCP8_FUSHE|nr:hypothetical protein FHETE_5984 [Fusarium heterosporum]
MVVKPSPNKTIGQKLRFLNPIPPFSSFPQFLKLPAEIRCMIWDFAMAYHRLVNVELRHTKDYGISYFHESTMSALFLTTMESRREAEKFYRIKIPGKSYGRHEYIVNDTLYLCPELDIVSINAAYSPLGGVLEFADSVLNRDPKGIGLINVGIPADASVDDANMMVGKISYQREHLAELVERFERVVFVQVAAPNQIYKHLYNASIPIAKLHRPTPVAGQATCYDILGTDPRPIRDELKHLYLGSVDPRRGYGAWKFLLSLLQDNNHKWNIIDRNTTYSFMLYCGEHHASYILDDASNTNCGAQAWNGGGFATYVRDVQKRSSGYDSMTQEILGTTQERNKMPLLAIGFWLFPVESIGSLASNMPWPIEVKLRYDRVENMTEYPPQLCLFHLP